MTIRQELEQYSKDCINGVIRSCKKHKQACQRLLNDFANKDSQYYWDEDEANKIVKWFSLLRHHKGILANQPIVLTTWQKFFLCQIYGWRRKDNARKRFTMSFIEVARKNAKSQMEAGVILYEISVQATKNQEIYETYCAGVKRDQSNLIFNECINLLTGSPLRSKFKITRDRIEHIKTRSFLKALCKQDGKNGDGTNPAVLVLDEYHQHPTTEFYDLGLGANSKESLLMIITTAGMDLTFPCYTEEYSYCSKILDPDVDVQNESYFVDILEMDEDDDPREMEIWEKANPIRMSYAKGREDIEKAWRIAKEIPEKMIPFMTKCLNKWVQQKENGYMDMSKWKECEVTHIPYDLDGAPVYVGFDMSAKIDLTSVAFVLPVQSDEQDVSGVPVVKYICFSHSFIPNQSKLRERILKDKVPYDAWERNGYLSLTDSEVVDQSVVMQYVLNRCKKENWKIECLCFDPANAIKLMTDLEDEGFPVEEIYQSRRSLNESTCGFREQAYCKNVIYTYNPLLNYAMSNAVTTQKDGYIKIDKDKSTKRIDPVDAMLCAFKLAVYHEFIDYQTDDEWLESEGW